MMKVDSDGVHIEKQIGDVQYVRADILADTKEEVEAMGTDGSLVEGLDDDAILTSHSTAFTVVKELGVLDSEGNWHW